MGRGSSSQAALPAARLRAVEEEPLAPDLGGAERAALRLAVQAQLDSDAHELTRAVAGSAVSEIERARVLRSRPRFQIPPALNTHITARALEQRGLCASGGQLTDAGVAMGVRMVGGEREYSELLAERARSHGELQARDEERSRVTEDELNRLIGALRERGARSDAPAAWELVAARLEKKLQSRSDPRLTEVSVPARVLQELLDA